MTCDRCERETNSIILSMFNEQDICLACKEIEEKHPDYDKACKAEAKAISDWSRRGSPKNFVGIGLPDDLVAA